jgi:hypothetical protein
MSTEFILFFAALGLLLLYPVLSWAAKRRLKALKTRLALEHCPKCREVFGPSIIRTAREFRGFMDPVPAGPLLRVVCPHCHVAWDYCNGTYTEPPAA